MFAATKIRFWLTTTAAAQLAEKKGEGYNVQWENGAPYINVNSAGVHGVSQENIEKISMSAEIADGGLLRGMYITEEEDVLMFVDTLPDGSQSIEITGHDLPEMLSFYTSIRAGAHQPDDNWELSREERLGSTATIALNDLMRIFLETLEENGCEVRIKKDANEQPKEAVAAPVATTEDVAPSEEMAKGPRAEPAETKPPDHPRSA